MKKIIWIVVIILIVWLVVASIKNDTNSGPIKIGVIAPLSGPVADYGEEIKAGVLAGKGNAEVEFVFEDEQCDAKTAVSAFQKLTTLDKVNFIIGPECGSPQEAVVPLLKGKEIISIVAAAASSDLFAASGGNFYNVQYSLQDESKFIAEQMYEMGFRNVALISYGTAFSQTHADSFRKNFKGKIAIDTTINDPNADVSTEATKIGLAKVDAIYSPDISLFFANGLAKLKERKVDVPVFSTYVVELPAVRQFVSGVHYSFPSDLGGPEGAVFSLAKQATEILVPFVEDCDGNYTCVKQKLDSSGLFDQFGVSKRGLIMKQIPLE